MQLPEVCDEKSEAFKAGYKNICEIGKERIRRAGNKLSESEVLRVESEANKQLDLDSNSTLNPQPFTLDKGFRVFKLDTSNLVLWDTTPIADGELQTLWDRFDKLENTIVRGRTDMDIVFEVMLKMGVPLDYCVFTIEINDKQGYSVGKDCMLV